MIAIWERMEIRNKSIRVRCPACSTLALLQRRKPWKFRVYIQPSPAPATALASPGAALELNDRPFHQARLLPEPPKQPPSLVGPQRFEPKKDRPAQSPRENKKHSRSWLSQPSPSTMFALAAMLIAVVAVVLVLLSPSGRLVNPLSVLAAVLALGTLTVAISAEAPRRWPAVAAILTIAILVLGIFYSNPFGPKFVIHQRPEVDSDLTFVTPKQGVGLTETPMAIDPNGADGSKYGLDRDWFHIQINNVSAGPAEVRGLSALGPRRTEPHLLIELSYGYVRDSMTGTNPTESRCGKLAVVLYDARGNRYERQDLAVTSLSVKSKGSGSYAGRTIQETMVFVVPPELDDGLRLEINVPPLGATPLTFTIPRSMISIQSASSSRK